MTIARPMPSRREIARADWCIRDLRDPAARRVAHLVDLDQPARPGGGRDALRGRAAAKWRPVEDLTIAQLACDACGDVLDSTADTETAPPPDPRPAPGRRLPEWGATPLGAGTPALAGPIPSRIGQGRPSEPRHDPIACTPAAPAEANTVAARVARRVAFRESWAPESDAYIPPEDSRRPQGVRLTDRFNT